VMKNPNIVPVAVQGKPISYGLWDTYRNRYNWKPVFELQNEGRLRETRTVYIAYINGEENNVLSENFPLKEFEKKAIPSELGFGWKDQEGQSYSGFGRLNRESVFAAFKEVYGEHPDQITADLDIRVNIPNTFFTVKLKGNGKDVFIKTDSIEIFKTDKK